MTIIYPSLRRKPHHMEIIQSTNRLITCQEISHWILMISSESVEFPNPNPQDCAAILVNLLFIWEVVNMKFPRITNSLVPRLLPLVLWPLHLYTLQTNTHSLTMPIQVLLMLPLNVFPLSAQKKISSIMSYTIPLYNYNLSIISSRTPMNCSDN